MRDIPRVTVHRNVVKALKSFDSHRLQWLDDAAALGPLVALYIGPVPAWVVTDADLARRMLVTESSSWARPPGTVTPIRMGVGENLFTQSDAAWAVFQPQVAPAFRKKALARRLAEIDALVNDEVSAIPRGSVIDLELAMGRIALIVAAWVLLGDHLDRTRAEEIAHHQREVVSWVGRQIGKAGAAIPVTLGASGRAMRHHRAFLDAYADDVIRRASASKASDDDVLGALRAARPADRPLSPKALRGHVLGLLFAGNETTAATLAWALVDGAASPPAWERLRTEPDRWTKAFITETMRLHPVAWGIPRTPTKPGVILTAGEVSVRVRRGRATIVYLRGINRDPHLWSDPLRFDPERHNGPVDELARTLLPFGLGPRACIGQHLALAEMHAVLPALARHGNVTVDGEIAEDPGFALRVRGGLRGRFTSV